MPIFILHRSVCRKADKGFEEADPLFLPDVLLYTRKTQKLRGCSPDVQDTGGQQLTGVDFFSTLKLTAFFLTKKTVRGEIFFFYSKCPIISNNNTFCMWEIFMKNNLQLTLAQLATKHKHVPTIVVTKRKILFCIPNFLTFQSFFWSQKNLFYLLLFFVHFKSVLDNVLWPRTWTPKSNVHHDNRFSFLNSSKLKLLTWKISPPGKLNIEFFYVPWSRLRCTRYSCRGKWYTTTYNFTTGNASFNIELQERGEAWSGDLACHRHRSVYDRDPAFTWRPIEEVIADEFFNERLRYTRMFH